MTQLKQTQSLSILKSTLAVLGASIGVTMAPVALAADPPGVRPVNGDMVKAAGDGSVRGLVPAVKTAPQGAEQQKGKCDKTAPVGAAQHKCEGGDGALIGLLTPVGPNGAKQVKLDGVAKPKTGQ
nr:hypothetical protein [Rhodoferax sp.]